MEAEHIAFHFKINDIQLNLGDSFNKRIRECYGNELPDYLSF